jgi:hypothetical protein
MAAEFPPMRGTQNVRPAGSGRTAGADQQSHLPRKASFPGTAGGVPRRERSGSRARRPVRGAAPSTERGGRAVLLRLDHSSTFIGRLGAAGPHRSKKLHIAQAEVMLRAGSGVGIGRRSTILRAHRVKEEA